MNRVLFPSVPEAGCSEFEVVIVTGKGLRLPGFLATPFRPRGTILFAHGGRESRFHDDNLHLAQRLHRRGFSTLVFNLLSYGEVEDPRRRGDSDLLAERMGLARSWLESQPGRKSLPVGFFGSQEGALVALKAACRGKAEPSALVCLDGEVHPESPALKRLRAPSLFVMDDDSPSSSGWPRGLFYPRSDPEPQTLCLGELDQSSEPDLEKLRGMALEWYSSHMAPL